MRNSTAETIVKRAVFCFAKRGFEAASFDYIAKEAGVSRPLVTHYFKRKHDLFVACVHYVGGHAQASTEKNLVQVEPHPWEYLRAYVHASFSWAEQHPDHFRFWVVFGLHCTWDRELRKINEGFKRAGRERLAKILRGGEKSGVFKIDSRLGVSKTTQLLHDLLYSRVIAFATEAEIPSRSAAAEIELVFEKILF
ncbi:MAG: TetR/AcrR family transcriptional regulator [Bacteriovoracia bacterium]